MKRWGALGAVVAIAVAVAAYFFIGGNTATTVDSTGVPTLEVTQGPFVVTLDVEGTIRAVNSVMISAPSTRYSLQIVELVEEGEVVAKGDLLVRLNSDDLVRDLDSLDADLKKFELNIEQKKKDIGAELERLDRDIDLARVARDKAALEVTESDTVPDIVKRRNKLALEEAELRLAKLKSDRNAREIALKNSLELLVLEKTKTLARLKEATLAKEKLEIFAPEPGLVMYVEAWRGGKRSKPAEGDTVWRGHKLLEIPDLAELEVLAWVHEVDVASVSVDQEAEVFLDAHPDASYKGTIKTVADLAITRNGDDSEVKEFEIVVKLHEKDAKVRPGMTARVNIPVEKLEDVVSVPLEAVSESGEKPLIYKKTAAGPEAVAVELGKRNDSRVVVTSGIAVGDVIYLGDPTGSGDEGPADEGAGAVKEAKAAAP